MTRNRRLQVGSFLLALAALGLLPASWAIAQGFDFSDRTGRHLLAGGLANLSLALLLALVAAVPIRRGDRWGFWAYCIPVLLYGLPMLVIDATRVAPASLLTTIGPQVLGLLTVVVGLTIVAPAMFGPRDPTPGPADRQ